MSGCDGGMNVEVVCLKPDALESLEPITGPRDVPGKGEMGEV